AACVALGLAALALARAVARAAAEAVGTAPLPVRAGLAVVPWNPAGPGLSTPLLAAAMAVTVASVALLAAVQEGRRQSPRTDDAPWACGYAYSRRMAYTSMAFAQPLRVLFRSSYALQAAARGAGPWLGRLGAAAMGLLRRAEPLWESGLYRPLGRGAVWVGRRVQSIQMGNVRVYGLYLIVTLIVLLLSAAR
ncbi:MAG: hydrogenase 4 subunit B, partial [Bacillota bacterium]